MFRRNTLRQCCRIAKHSRQICQLNRFQSVSKCYILRESLSTSWPKSTPEINLSRRLIHLTSPVGSLSDQEIKRHMNGISDKFTEAMELLSEARSSKGTVYFSEDMNEAESTITEVLNDYKHLLESLSESQSRDVMRAIGLKMEELKAQLQMLKESIKD